MRSTAYSRSRLRSAIWVYVAPFVVLGGLALFVLGFGVLAVAMQLVAAMLKHASI